MFRLSKLSIHSVKMLLSTLKTMQAYVKLYSRQSIFGMVLAWFNDVDIQVTIAGLELAAQTYSSTSDWAETNNLEIQ